MKLEYKYDVDINAYFKMSKEEREEITTLVAEAIIQNTKPVPAHIHFVLVTLQDIVRKAEEDEEYEKADMFFKIEKKIFDRLDNIL